MYDLITKQLGWDMRKTPFSNYFDDVLLTIPNSIQDLYLNRYSTASKNENGDLVLEIPAAGVNKDSLVAEATKERIKLSSGDRLSYVYENAKYNFTKAKISVKDGLISVIVPVRDEDKKVILKIE